MTSLSLYGKGTTPDDFWPFAAPVGLGPELAEEPPVAPDEAGAPLAGQQPRVPGGDPGDIVARASGAVVKASHLMPTSTPRSTAWTARYPVQVRQRVATPFRPRPSCASTARPRERS